MRFARSPRNRPPRRRRRRRRERKGNKGTLVRIRNCDARTNLLHVVAGLREAFFQHVPRGYVMHLHRQRERVYCVCIRISLFNTDFYTILYRRTVSDFQTDF